MTLENPHLQREIHLHSRWIFHCHLSFRRVMNDLKQDFLRDWSFPMFQTPEGHDGKNPRVNKT